MWDFMSLPGNTYIHFSGFTSSTIGISGKSSLDLRGKWPPPPQFPMDFKSLPENTSISAVLLRQRLEFLGTAASSFWQGTSQLLYDVYQSLRNVNQKGQTNVHRSTIPGLPSLKREMKCKIRIFRRHMCDVCQRNVNRTGWRNASRFIIFLHWKEQQNRISKIDILR